MHLFIVADTKLAIPNSIIHANIMDILNSCAHCKEVQPIIVSDHLLEIHLHAYQQFEGVRIQSNNTASQFIQGTTNTIVIHYGANINWSKSFSNYFIPLFVPNEKNGSSYFKRLFEKRQFKAWIQKANAVLAINDWIAESLQAEYPLYSKQIQSIYLPSLTPQHIEWQELSAAKELLTEGNNYFLAFVPVERFISILKSFSVFKKWQQTTMHLVFVFDTEKEVNIALEQLKGYRFRQDISIHLTNEIQAQWIAATYAILFEGIDCSKTYWVNLAIQYEIPLMFDNKINLPESWLNAGEVLSFTENQVVSNHFKLYYKDEVYRQARARMGMNWLAQLNDKRSQLELFNKIVLSLNK